MAMKVARGLREATDLEQVGIVLLYTIGKRENNRVSV